MKEIIDKIVECTYNIYKSKGISTDEIDSLIDQLEQSIEALKTQHKDELEKKKDGMQPSGNHLPDEWVDYEMGKKPRPKESK